jgi:circadian clock protein KaiB
MRDVLVSCTIYVVEHAPNSQNAIRNLTDFCRTFLPGHHRIEIVDVFLHPERALADKILLTPTLIIGSSSSARRIVGDLSEGGVLRQALGLNIQLPETLGGSDA